MAPSTRSDLRIPEKWGLTQLTLHYEGEDLSKEAKPFAATLLLQLRLDVRPGASLKAISEVDLGAVRRNLPNLELLGSGALDFDGQAAQYIEWINPDPNLGSLHQMVVYVQNGSRIYTVTGTHRSDRFETIRDDIREAAMSLLPAK